MDLTQRVSIGMRLSPLKISILICTFNRSALLRRAIQCVLRQTYENFELVIIDDCSSDNTSTIVQEFKDSRIRYIRNDYNLGSKHGDRIHLRRFINELMRGEYFVYLCDDDYWPNPNLLEKQMQMFDKDLNLAMAIGGQFSYTPISKDEPIEIKNASDIDWQSSTYANLYPNCYMCSDEFLTQFSKHPTMHNLIAGATLYSKKHFIMSGALSTVDGSQWQAGYELSLGPGCTGNVAYLDEPSIIVTVVPENASFQGTQLSHYRDALLSITTAFRTPLSAHIFSRKRKFFKKIKRRTIQKLSKTFLHNTIAIKAYGWLTLASKEHISQPVQPIHVLQTYYKFRIIPNITDFALFGKIYIAYLKRATKPIARYITRLLTSFIS